MEMKAHFDDAHPLLSFTEFFAVLLHQLFINWVFRVEKLRSMCLPFLQSLADSFAALDERSNCKASSTPAKWRSASISIRNSGEATPRTPSAAAAAAKCSSSSCCCVLTREEVGVLMAKLGLQQQADGDDAAAVGSVDDIPFLFEDNEPSFEEVREAFQVFDRNGDGYIDAHELHDVLSLLGFQEGSSMDSCKEMISAFDNDKDGRVDFHDFVRLMETSFNC